VKNKITLIFVILFSFNFVFAQKIQKDTLTRKQLLIKDPLTPSKAAFYSAVVPGLGQIYTRKYWKLPIIYGALGTSGYYYFYQSRKMKVFRDIYKRRIAGYTDDIYARRIFQNDQLIQGMNFHKRYRDLSVLFFMGFYLLNILDANVGAHLMQFNVDNKLTFRPHLEPDLIDANPNFGLTLNIKL